MNRWQFARGNRALDRIAHGAESPQNRFTMQALAFHNSRTRMREAFTPADPEHIRMYVCGPTVYDLPHLGNIRSTVVFDVVARLLRALYPRVTYVRNITDIDDKIAARAAENNEPIDAVTARTTLDYQADMRAIGNLPPDVEPCATGHVPEMVEVIERLIAGGYAYAVEGHVLFAVTSFAQYGALSGRSPEDLLAGARIEVAPYKRDPGDFVLWKPSTPDQPGWDSPWGRGRPGWHIECSAMAWRYLGESFDIHGGGTDLLFPHHENERAQSLCAFPTSAFARVWLHNGMLQVNGAKMSKSLGNFFTLRDVLVRAPAEAVRLLILRTHYRAVLDFTDTGLIEAKQEMDRFYRALERTPSSSKEQAPASIMAALCDDLNTPDVVAEMRALAKAALGGDENASSSLYAAGKLLGLFTKTPDLWFRSGSGSSQHIDLSQPAIVGSAATLWTDAAVEQAIAERRTAREKRDFQRADHIRTRLTDAGIILEDSASGTTWRRA